MRRDGAELNEILEKAFEDAPRRIEEFVPIDVGNGTISRTVTKEGVILITLNMSFFEDHDAESQTGDDYIYLWFCFGERVSCSVGEERKIYDIENGQACIYEGSGLIERVTYQGGKTYNLRCMKIPASYYYAMLGKYFDSKERDRYRGAITGDITYIDIDNRTEHIFTELKDYTQYQSGPGYLYLESKINELLSLVLASVFKADIVTASACRLEKSKVDAAVEARRIIDDEIRNVPGRNELARLVGTSTTILGKSFREVFGTSIHAYVIDQRLEKGAALLLGTDMSVKEICTEIGYSKASNFAAAFKRKYGVIPSRYRTQLQRGGSS